VIVIVIDSDSGGAVTSRLVHMTSDQAVRVGALAGYIVLCSWTRNFSLIASFHPGVLMATGEFNAGL